jgi:hypothetical protein
MTRTASVSCALPRTAVVALPPVDVGEADGPDAGRHANHGGILILGSLVPHRASKGINASTERTATRP